MGKHPLTPPLAPRPNHSPLPGDQNPGQVHGWVDPHLQYNCQQQDDAGLVPEQL